MTKEKLENQRNIILKNNVRDFLKTDGHERSVTVIESGALIPKEVVKPVKRKADVLDLTAYVNVVPVTTAAGTYPVIKKSTGELTPVAELEEDPTLGMVVPQEIEYSIQTYRGKIPISHEMVDDGEFDVMEVVAETIEEYERNTKNRQIANKFKLATAKAVTGADNLIELINKEIESEYEIKCFISKSLHNELDLLVDKTGRYLLTEDPTVKSGKRLKGKEIVIIDDLLIGSAEGDLVGFIGDAYEFIAVFDRQQVTVKWMDNDFYAQTLGAHVRFDTEVTDATAGYYVTYTPAAVV